MKTIDRNRTDNLLLKLGFEYVGNWLITNDSIDYNISKYGSERKILYAFVSEKQALYIGKTIRSLKQRMYDYINPGPTQSTNIKNHSRIKKILFQNKPIDIYVFPPKENIEYKGIPVNLAAGLEDSLIEIIKPLWNDTGKNSK